MMRRLTIDDIERFTEGDCHYLARAIYKRTGWCMAAFTSDRGADLHAFVVMPDGRLLDIYGPQTRAQARKRWSCRMAIKQYEWKHLRAFGTPPLFGSSTYKRARVIAERLLSSLEMS